MKKTRKWMRNFHRDLGYFFAGIIVIYAVSGFLLNHFSHGDVAYIDIEFTVALDSNLTKTEVQAYMEKHHADIEVKKYKLKEKQVKLYLKNGKGVYSQGSGELEISSYKKNTLIYYMNRLHFNSLKYWTYIADAFAIALVFFAISGLIIVKGKKGFMRRGIYLTVIGIILPLLICLLN